MKSISPQRTAWLYGPIGAGALGVLMISFVIVVYLQKYKYIFSQPPIFAKIILMRIVIAATDSQWEEWPSGDKKTEWIRVADGNAFAKNKDADAFVDLNENVPVHSYGDLKKPVLVNAVTSTLSEMHAPANVIRINGWPGFLQRPVWEVAGKIDEAVTMLFAHLDKKIINVADEPGFISARIITMIINEAYFATGAKVSSRDEIDIAMKLGTNYPFGPFQPPANIGPASVLQLLQQLNKTDKRYDPAPFLLNDAMINRP